MRCLLVNPRFRTDSFWNYKKTCEAAGARYPAPPLGLITVAALLPADWDLTLVDCNVRPWRADLLDEADLVLIGGMIPQQLDTLALIRQAKARGKTVVVGGPDATSSPHLYAEADHLVLGEAEVTLPLFHDDWAHGRAKRRYETTERPDVSQSPCPRFDLLDIKRYLHIGVQWCRGCPFTCEFCDIIELYGRVPRAKTVPQFLHELDTLYALGYRGHVDLVDDNFIGNKKLVKVLLPQLRDWLDAHDWPFEFSTEASLNLADDDELLGMMQEVGFFSIFVGIESPDETTLLATKKRQNTRRSIADSIRKIHRHGIFVNAGYIVGFDAESGRVANAMIDLIEATSIPVNMVGLLYALPNTQLARRLAAEGRLEGDHGLVLDGQGDQCTAGLNYRTLRPRQEILEDYLQVVETTYAPRSYFARALRVGLDLDASKRRFRPPPREYLRSLRTFLRFAFILTAMRGTGGPFWRTLWRVARQNPQALYQVVVMSAMYIHMGPFAGFVAARTREALARLVPAAVPVRPAPVHTTWRPPSTGRTTPVTYGAVAR